MFVTIFVCDVRKWFGKFFSADGGVAINDFKLMLLLYADDLVIFAETPDELQLQIDKLYNYCQKWKLLTNTEKLKMVVFRKGTWTCQEKWLYGKILIPVSSRIPSLELVFSSNGSYSRTRFTSQIAKFMGPTWGPPGSGRPQMGPMLAPWILQSGIGWSSEQSIFSTS